MAIILFYGFKELYFSSKIINKAASNIFAVFALNNALVNAAVKILTDHGLTEMRNVFGFLRFAAVVLLILILEWKRRIFWIETWCCFIMMKCWMRYVSIKFVIEDQKDNE